MKAAEFIAAFLKAQGISHVFELSGGMITHILDAIAQTTDIKIVSMHHEQGASFAADGMGRCTNKPGVALATSGPGATNLLTGIGSCYFDSVPGLFITGQVNPNEQRGTRAIRQLGFQETDIAAMAEPIVKKSYRITAVEQLPLVFEEAYQLAISGRPGPVLIDIPMDMQRAEIKVGEIPVIERRKETLAALNQAFFDQLNKDLAASERPLVLAGRGVRASGCENRLRQFLEKTGIPLVTSLLGVDLLPYEHRQRVGFIGSYGNRWANMAIGKSDFILVLGSRLDIRQTSANTKDFKGERTIYHVDCEEGEINNRVLGCQSVVADLEDFLAAAQGQVQGHPSSGWLQELKELQAQWPDTNELKDRVKGINPNVFLHELSRASQKAASYVVDVGNHQMWAAQSLELAEGQTLHTSGGMGAMGFSMPASIGCCFAQPGRAVVCVVGDGSAQINIQELQTIVRNRLPVKLVILNNQCYGMIRQFQDSYFASRYQSTYWGYSSPDFAAVAQAYGIDSATVTDDTSDGLQRMWADENAPFLLQVMIDPHANAFPKIAYGHPITEMEPFAKPIGVEST